MKMTNAIVLISLLGLTACFFPGKSELNFRPGTTAPAVIAEEAVDFEYLKANILQPKCIGCHKGMAKEEGLAKYVKPGQPEESRLFISVKDGSMPKGGPALSTAELDIVRAFIKNEKGRAATFDNLKAQILVPHCLSCHKSKHTEEGLAKWINFDAPLESKLLLRVQDGSMPKGGKPLDAKEQAFIAKYLKGVKKPKPEEPSAPKFADFKAKILVPYCLKCHEDMDNEKSLMDWIDKDSPEQSALNVRVQDGSMPEEGGPLSPELKEYVLKFVKGLRKK